MYKLFCLILLGIAVLGRVNAQSLHVNKTRFVGGDSTCGSTECSNIINTSDGGILFIGGTSCYAGGGDIPVNFPSTDDNALVGKLNSNMQISWIKVFGGSQHDFAASAVQTSDGGYAVLCTTQSTDRDVTGNHGGGVRDLWVLRLDILGNLLWQKCYGSTYDESPISLAIASDGGFVIFGISNGLGGDVPTHYSSSQFDYDWIIIKTDSAGNRQWSKSMGGTGDEYLSGTIIAKNNGYFVIGTSNSPDYECLNTTWHRGIATEYDIYIFNLDLAGNILWDSSYGGSGGDLVFDAKLDPQDSSIIINGITLSNDYMVSGNHGQEDFWVVKVDKTGALKWQRCLGGPNLDEGTSIIKTQFGYLAYGSTNRGTFGLQNAHIFALDTLGNVLSGKQFGGSSYEWSAFVLPYMDAYLTCGTSSSSFFTEGLNTGHNLIRGADAFLTYMDYWGLGNTSQNEVAGKLLIYPNPSSNSVNISPPANRKEGSTVIFNMVGQQLFSTSLPENEPFEINTTAWNAGIYIVRWQGNDGLVLTEKLIIK